MLDLDTVERLDAFCAWWHARRHRSARGARCQANIRKVMRSAFKLTVRELMQKTNYRRVGADDWHKALDMLVKAGEVRIAREPGKRGQTRKIVKWRKQVQP